MKYLMLVVCVSLLILNCEAFGASSSKSSYISMKQKRFFQRSSSTITSQATFSSNVVAHQTDHSSQAYLQLIKFLPILKSVVDPTILGGLLSGGLHAVTGMSLFVLFVEWMKIVVFLINIYSNLGPDHIAALLPSSVGRPMWVGAKIGAIWGLGHGVAVMILGSCAYFLKGKLIGKFAIFHQLTSLAENAVGISLVLIGLLGVKESLESDEHHNHNGDALSNEIKGKKSMSTKAIFANGALHGFSWDGAPSIAPALAMNSWQAAVYFLSAYSLGTVIAMSISASTIGALSSTIGKIGNFSKSPDFPKKISLYSSMLAVIIGLYWIAQGFFK